jgi:hypothetical protein
MFISKHNGNVQNFGTSAGKMRNNYEIWENPDKTKFVKMEALKNGKIFQFLFDFDDLDKVLKDSKTWYIQSNNYVAKSDPFIYFHHFVMNFEGSGNGFQQISIDHINRNPLDNRKHNLRLATCKEQQQNSKGQIEGTKRARSKTARSLPDGLTQEDLPKYVVYYQEMYGPEDSKKMRNFFRIEKHPAQLCNPPLFKNKWATSKKMIDYTIHQKLTEAKIKIQEMDKSLFLSKVNT